MHDISDIYYLHSSGNFNDLKIDIFGQGSNVAQLIEYILWSQKEGFMFHLQTFTS